MEILESSLFLWGLILGGACLAAISGLFATRPDLPPLRIGGLLISAATMGAFSLGGEHSDMAWWAVGALFVLTAGAELARATRELTALLSIPGAVLMALAAPSHPWWFRFVVVVSVPIAGYLITDFEVRYRDWGLGMLFLGLAVAGTFFAVPDTELARAMIAVSFPIMFLAWPRAKVALGASGAYLSVAVLSLTATAGGIGRPASVVGAMACLGFLLIEPVVVRLRPRVARLPDSLPRTPEAALIATIPQFVFVLVASRVAGPLDEVLPALGIVLGLWLVSFLALWLAGHRRVPERTG